MTEHEAASILHRYVMERGHTPVTVTKHLVRYWWKILNLAVFGGVLPKARHLELIFDNAVYAWAIPGSNGRIDLHMQHTFHERTTFLTVLVHEMVHAWEYMTRGRMGHGKQFSGWGIIIAARTPLVLRKGIKDYEHNRRRPNRQYPK